MTTALERWRKVYELFDPVVPAMGDIRVPREKYNPLAEIIAPRLGLPLPFQKFVLAGGVGSGKSTELRATIAGLTGPKLVVLVDLWQRFGATHPGAIDHLQPAELVGLLGLAVLRTGTDILGHRWGHLEDNLSAAIAANSGEDGPQVDAAKLSKELAIYVGTAAVGALTSPVAIAGAGLAKAGLEGSLHLLKAVSQATSWKWKIGLRGRGRSTDEDTPVRAMIHATNALMDAIRKDYKRNVVLLVDGLDRIENSGTFEDLFVESGLLGELRCDVVTTLKLEHVEKFRSRLHWCKTFDFTYVPVALPKNPHERHRGGMDFFHDLAQQRFKQLGEASLITPEDLEELAYHSGGRLRDFISLVREVAVLAMLEEASQATRKHIQEAIDALRREREAGLNTAHIDVLKQVMADPQRKLPAGDAALDLLHRQCLLAYPNKSTWYLPHTTLMLELLAPIGETDSASS